MSKQSRRWCFTSFEVPSFTDSITYYCYQQEIAPSTGKLHYQGYLEVQKKITLSGLKKLIHFSPHLEISRGSAQQAVEYCSKVESAVPGSFIEYGQRLVESTESKRSDLEELLASIKAGKSDLQIIEERPSNIRHLKYIDKIRIMYAPTNSLRDVVVYYIWGPPGTGKSMYVWNKVSGQSYSKPLVTSTQIWWEDYVGQSIVWLDDFYYEFYSLPFLLTLFDKYPLSLQKKGGCIPAAFTTVYITTNSAPPKNQALLRRLTIISLA